LYENTLGPDRTVRLNRFHSALMNGPLLFGSDTMPMGPLYGIVGALSHPDPSERLGAFESLSAYSKGGLSHDAAKVPFEPGRSADLAVLKIGGGDLDRSLREGRAEVVWTSARGEIIFSDAAASAPPSFRGQS
jgi:predicted amidohydrolase YtcJ